MKTKVFLCLSAGLVVFLLGGVIMTQMVNAQMQWTGPNQPMSSTGGCNKILWDYDSGWEQIAAGETLSFDHGLGGDHGEYFVYVIGKTNTGWSHQSNFGTRETAAEGRRGLKWGGCDSNTISVYREVNDVLGHWDEVRVRILKNQ